MKKILVLILMVCVVCNVSVDAKTKKKARKVKAKTERAMTEFEKRQKEERLANELMWCQYYYNKGDIENANRYKRNYERVNAENYYVEFTNIVHSEKEKAEWKRKFGHTLDDGRYFYVDGLAVFIHFDTDGKACDWTDYSYMCLEYDVKKELMGYNTRTYYNAKKALIEEINELSGYNAKLANKTDEMDEFISQHTIKKEKNQPSATERSKANNDACKKHKEEAYGKYYKNAQNIKVTKKNADSNSTLCVYGVVTDESQEPLIGAVVEAVHTQSGTKYYATSNIEGRYNIQSMRAGDYTISVKYVGYSNSTYSGIYLELGNSYNLNVPMELSSRY